MIKEKISKGSILPMILSFIGLCIMLSFNELNFSNVHLVGLLLGSASAVFLGLEILLKKKLTAFYRSDIIVLTYFIVAVVLLTPFVSFSRILSLDTPGLISLLALSLVITAFGVPFLA